MSEFLKSAIKLDQSFTELTNLSLQLEAAELNTEYGMNQARKILGKFSECGQRVGEEIQLLAKNLEDSRQGAESAAQAVSERAQLVQKRHETNEKIFTRFQELGGSVRVVTNSLSTIPQDQEALSNYLMPLLMQLDRLFEESDRIKYEAQYSNLRTLEKDADSMSQTIRSLRAKLSKFVTLN